MSAASAPPSRRWTRPGSAFNNAEGTGVIIAVEDVARSGPVDYMVVGSDLVHAKDLEKRALEAFPAA